MVISHLSIYVCVCVCVCEHSPVFSLIKLSGIVSLFWFFSEKNFINQVYCAFILYLINFFYLYVVFLEFIL